MLLLLVLLAAVLFAGIAMTIGEGLWSNTVALLLILLSGMIAQYNGRVLGAWGFQQVGSDDSFAWYFDFAGIWGVFSASLAIFRVYADTVSRTRMRFLPVIEKIGGPLMGIFVAVMFTSFATCTLLIPVGAGQWNLPEASESQQSTFLYMTSPFTTVVKRFESAYQGAAPNVPKGE